VRVNQAGYPTGSSKRAYLLSSVPEPGAVFHVTNARGRVVLSVPVRTVLGRWSARFPDVYAIDFSRLKAPGTYTVTVTGAAGASSPPAATMRAVASEPEAFHGWMEEALGAAPDLAQTTSRGVQLYVGQADYRIGQPGAWADPGEPIETGQKRTRANGQAVTKTGSLGLLATGATGLKAWRQQRGAETP